jgi:LysR family transcriptional regulator of abg operon
MKLAHLRHLTAVVEAGSFRQAGRDLNISQSAITKSIRMLEDELGVTLLNRESHGVSATASGEALVRRAKFIETELQSARSEVRSIEDARIGDIRVSASPSVAMNLLPRTILRLKEKHPRITIRVEEGIYPDVLGRVRNGDVDVAICLIPERVDDDELAYEILMEDVVVPAVRSDHPLARARQLTLRDLSEHEWIVFGRRGDARAVFDHMFRQEGLRPPDSAIDCSSFTCAISLAESANYLVLVPQQIFADRRRTLSLTPLWLDVTLPSWTTGAVTRSASRPSPACEEFLRQLRVCACASEKRERMQPS